MMGNTYCAASVNISISDIPALSYTGPGIYGPLYNVVIRFNELNGSYVCAYQSCGSYRGGTVRRKNVDLIIEDGIWKVSLWYAPAAPYLGEPTSYIMKFRINPSNFTPCDPSGTSTFDILVDTWDMVGGYIPDDYIPPLTGTAVVSK